jgi:hypothetical protein
MTACVARLDEIRVQETHRVPNVAYKPFIFSAMIWQLFCQEEKP